MVLVELIDLNGNYVVITTGPDCIYQNFQFFNFESRSLRRLSKNNLFEYFNIKISFLKPEPPKFLIILARVNPGEN